RAADSQVSCVAMYMNPRIMALALNPDCGVLRTAVVNDIDLGNLRTDSLKHRQYLIFNSIAWNDNCDYCRFDLQHKGTTALKADKARAYYRSLILAVPVLNVMKLLFAVSSLDLKRPFSATPSWWQLLKALYEVGVEVIATPYQGPAIESLWWQTEPN